MYQNKHAPISNQLLRCTHNPEAVGSNPFGHGFVSGFGQMLQSRMPNHHFLAISILGTHRTDRPVSVWATRYTDIGPMVAKSATTTREQSASRPYCHGVVAMWGLQVSQLQRRDSTPRVSDSRACQPQRPTTFFNAGARSSWLFKASSIFCHVTLMSVSL